MMPHGEAAILATMRESVVDSPTRYQLPVQSADSSVSLAVCGGGCARGDISAVNGFWFPPGELMSRSTAVTNSY
ncbi:hypothetical protein E2C01_062998 [Portunus trituberculatus]|uniref:Uncharacterized protein n=1 Tax=Portunus trituberculatus TaxID=210409 RepID=A0A5B7HJ33_PORTR|nr:hypothetical protein [Portunus trituberculatus]